MKVLISILLLFLSSISYSGLNFEKALDLANKRNFKEAAVLFENELLTDSTNTSTLFNLGNCYFELKQYGKAILAYEKVLKISPSDDEAVESIELCYNKLDAQLIWKPSLSGFERIVVFIGSNTWAYFAIILGLLIAYSTFRLTREQNVFKKRFHRVLFGLELILIIACFYASYAAANFSSDLHFAIVTKKSVPAFENEDLKKSSLTLLEGEKIEILSSGEKMKIKRFDGSMLWIKLTDAEMI